MFGGDAALCSRMRCSTRSTSTRPSSTKQQSSSPSTQPWDSRVTTAITALSATSVGTDYLVSAATAVKSNSLGARITNGILAVLHGERPSFEWSTLMHQPQPRWYVLQVLPMFHTACVTC